MAADIGDVAVVADEIEKAQAAAFEIRDRLLGAALRVLTHAAALAAGMLIGVLLW